MRAVAVLVLVTFIIVLLDSTLLPGLLHFVISSFVIMIQRTGFAVLEIIMKTIEEFAPFIVLVAFVFLLMQGFKPKGKPPASHH